MRKLLGMIAMLVVANAFADAITAANPVTGDIETYTYRYVGDGSWTASDWVDEAGENPVEVPQAYVGLSSVWDSLLIDGEKSIVADVEGWCFNCGLFNGANLTISSLTKWQGGCCIRVDDSSKLTVSAFGSGTFGDNIDFYVAAPEGIVYGCDYEYYMVGNFYYYFSGSGSVSYKNLYGGNHTIKAADITLSAPAEKTLASKTLMSFSNQPGIELSADVSIKDSSGKVVKIVYCSGSITATQPTITAEDPVGTCQFVKTDTGIVLYYVDGDPAELGVPTYTRSISINFTEAEGKVLTTNSDIGLSEYAVPGLAWNSMVGQNGTLDSVSMVDLTGATSIVPGVTVEISSSRGAWRCDSLDSSCELRSGYIDENSILPTPTVVVSGIPFEKYRVVVYHSTDTTNAKFGYDTINGVDCTYENGFLTTGTSSWGNAGADQSALPIEEGVNTLVSGILADETLTVIGHRMSGSERGCIAAIQIVEVDLGANDVIIEVDGDTVYPVDSDLAVGTVYATGIGTLTFEGEGSMSAETLEIEGGVTVKMGAECFDATTVTGNGVALYDGIVPQRNKGWTDNAWRGTVWVRNRSGITGDDNQTTGVQFNTIGNDHSKVMLSGVSGWVESPVEIEPEIVLENDGFDYALQLTNGNSPVALYGNRATVIKRLAGAGTLCRGVSSNGAWPALKVYDASGFTGSIDATGSNYGSAGMVVIFCEEDTVFEDSLLNLFSSDQPAGNHRSIYVARGCSVTVSSGVTWKADTGFIVEGTLNVNGNITSSHATKAVSGSGEVVFTGRGPTVSGDAWWKNADWTGTVRVKNVSNLVGQSSYNGTYIDYNECGNTGSVLEFSNVSGWVPAQYTCTVPLKIEGTFRMTDGFSRRNDQDDFAFKVCTLLGSGSICANNRAPTVVFNVTDDWSGFTGAVTIENKCVVFGKTIPYADDLTEGAIYISEGASVEIASSGIWWALGGIWVDGELRMPNLGKIGDTTSVVTSDTGVFTLTNTGNIYDTNTDYARIGGTGTLKFESASNWRMLSTNNLSTALAIQSELGGGLLLAEKGVTYEIGSLAGSKGIRSDYNFGNRNLRIHQSKDTTWSGTFGSADRVGTVYVTGGEDSVGTLTLSGEQTHDNGLQIETNGSVNLTGRWIGATTVCSNGMFCGTGVLTGNLTFEDHSVFKPVEVDEDGLEVSGTVNCQGVVIVDVSDVGVESDVVLITAEDIDAEGFALAEGTPESYSLAVENGALVLKWAGEPVCLHDGETTVLNAVAATCTDPGYSGDIYCGNCGELITAGETIPALGHNIVLVYEPATQFESGKIIYHCRYNVERAFFLKVDWLVL